MRKTGGIMFGVLCLLAAGAAQAQAPQVNSVLQEPTTPQPYTLPGQIVPPGGGGQQPPAVGSIGQMPVRVWAPVAPYYDPLADRTGAANPFPAGPEWSVQSLSGYVAG